jgi:16S rRNA processing protein RimM
VKRAAAIAGADGLLVGVIVGASGLKGEVKVKSFTAQPTNIGDYGPLFAEDGRNFAIESVRTLKGDVVVVRLKGINDRDSAETLKGVRLYVSRGALPETKKGEFYHTDLIGLRVEDTSGNRLGVVSAIHNFGAGDMIEIEDERGEMTMLPFTRSVVKEIDIAGARVVVTPPALEE